MGHPNPEVTFGIETRSGDSKYRTAHPHGDWPGIAGSASGAGATQAASGPGGSGAGTAAASGAGQTDAASGPGGSASGGSGGGGFDAAADYAARSAGARYANNFNYASDTALRDSSYGGAGTFASRMTLSTVHGSNISGKACRLAIPKDADEGTIAYRHSFDGLNAQTKAVKVKRGYYQFQIYLPSYILDHRFKTAGDTSDTSHKFAIIAEADQSFTNADCSEIVVTNRRFHRFATAYRMRGSGSTGDFTQSITDIPGSGGNPDFRWQNAIDTGAAYTTNAQAKERFGPLHYSFTAGNAYGGGTLTAQGNPEASAAINGIVWVPDAINVVEVFWDSSTGEFRLWHAVRGQAPRLVMNFEGDADLTYGNRNYCGVQLVPRLEELIADATREDTYAEYIEPIFHDDPIAFPGGFALGTLPTWYSAIADSVFATPVSNTIDSVKPSPLPPGQSGHAAVTQAYSGGAGNEMRGSLNVKGGGHGDYAGNEHYECRMNVNSPAWARRFGPTATGSIVSGDTYGDGKPSSIHTRSNYLSVGDFDLLVGMAGFWQNGFTTGKVWKYLFSTGAYTNVATFNSLGMVIDDALNGEAVYNKATGLVYLVNQNGEICSYNPRTNAVALVTDAQVSGLSYEFRIACWHTLNALVLYRPSNNQLRLFNLASPGSGWTSGQSLASAPISFTECPMFEFHKKSNGMLMWGQTSTRQRIYKLSPPNSNPTSFAQLQGTWTWSQYDFTGSTPDSPFTGTGGSTRGRGRVIENLNHTGRDVIVIVNSVTSPVYAGRLPATGLNG